MKNIKLSIIVPFFNRADYLIETLQSILLQDFNNFEVLIVDDGSNPVEKRKAEIFIDSLDHRYSYNSRPNNYPKGANSCRSYGFQIAKGDYIKWFDSDDLMEKEFLKEQFQVLEGGDFDGVLANCGVYNNNFSIKLRKNWRRINFSDDPIKDYVRTQLAWPTGAGMWKKSSIQNLAPFSQDLNNGQEWVFHLFILTAGLKIGVLQKELLKIRSHENSISQGNNGKRTKSYMLNRFKARIIVLSRLIETGNPHKKYVIKSIFEMLKKIKPTEYPLYLNIVKMNLRLKKRITISTSELVKL